MLLRRLKTTLDDNYEDIGRHSESGYLRKLSNTQLPKKTVWHGSRVVDGGLYRAEVLMTQSPASSKALASHYLQVRMSGVADDSWYQCELYDSEVQVRATRSNVAVLLFISTPLTLLSCP